MPYVEVRDATGTLIHTYEMVVGEYGTLVTDEDLFEVAKQNVIEDELVSPDQADKLSFRVTG
ncbi:protein of unknown function [Magnetospira sp. QH-2]|nr:protein of unknown function [Magnetospira sp. QH-2]